jgi:retron-type reverse transcriptase
MLLKALRSSTTIHDVAALLGYKASSLAFIVYGQDAAAKYTQFEIPKRYGGTRRISAPTAELKLLQSRLSDLLQNCQAEINEANGRADRIERRVNALADRISHGFRRNRSIITNAKEHRNRKFVFNADLKDFFGSINFGRVRGFLIKDRNFSLKPEIATLLAQIACHENSLPQGSPCSPVLSNLIGHVLDVHLVGLAAKKGCIYSRYADDLTFSTNKPAFPSSIAASNPANEHSWRPGNELARLVAKSGFEINPAKTRMQYRNSRQEVTGLVVNKKVNVRSEYRSTVRAMVHHLFTKGSFEILQRSDDGKGGVTIDRIPGTLNQLHGMLGFIDGVDLYNKRILASPKGGKETVNITSKESMYRRFLLFKEFYAAPMPVIVCEGKTDNVYIMHAIRSLVAANPRLATVNTDGTIKLNVRIFKYSETSTGRILKMNGGTGDLGNFMRDYRADIARFKAPGQQHPVILLIDNDSGAAPLYNIVKQITGKKPSGTEPFIHVTGNLYLSATPLKPGGGDSMIEDFFDAATKATPVSGKTFAPDASEDSSKHYGKIVFAHKVVRAHAGTIDFNGFQEILSNIASVIDAHELKLTGAVVP